MHELESYQLMVIALGAIAFGVYLLVKGGDWTIDNAVVIAEKSGLSKLFIAATIVAFGTSAPELFTSINANLSGYPGISVGNVIGSNIANVLMVVGISAVIAPIVFSRTEVRVDALVMIAATAAMAVAILNGLLPRWGGFAMVAAIIAYILYQYKASKLDIDEGDGDDSGATRPGLMLILGIVTLLVGSELLVQGAVAGGVALGVPEAVIGMTMIAFGTSLPELTACVAAARKNQSDMIIGGIVGSNIFNILSVMAFSAVAKPLIIESRFAEFDMPIVIVVTLLFAVFLLFTGRIGRLSGALMAVAYLIFTVAQFALR
ncbi:calcium/sodium antiporter [Oceaniglobus ichthyenteri]|uniref:calcium/sodium antiporter n=1 Tax=Oceaniglobus ichthyenteri TaxID=2136177 RepID=UPI000D3D7E6C|nr:calcium/sodium antiporter [Oceaniglobus ichthyenteri]